ncbi:MAG: hypothetical protein ACD_45C00149G0001 [uncultured bacterium]|nr:MAG: hypothetical protein ACD_45C00149G0001 [uncultured bacterium]OGT58312.1 MAG: hypothetical protein A3F43_05140 [Gammaproteobacteria bacterium RIFCSPHIGHO2_12_FULL_42_10]
MTQPIVSTTIEILGKSYPIRCQASEVRSLEEAALWLNEKMNEIKESGKAINLERIAIITALNIAHQFLQLDQQKYHIAQRLTHLKQELDTALNNAKQAELEIA